MKPTSSLLAACLLAFSSLVAAQLPPGITQEMIASALPEEGAPIAVAGRYEVASELAFDAAGLKIFRPSELNRFPRRDTLPVVLWGNGGCAIDNANYSGFLETIASHGFLVITTTAPAGAPRRQATAADLAAGISWAERENQRAGSPLAGKIEVSKVAVMGQSCGGRLSLELGGDPRVSTIGVFNSGLQPAQYALLTKLHGTVLIINGHERDFMFGPAKATYDAIDKLPAFYGARHGAGHTATAYHAGGGEFANVAANWVRWQFKGNGKAARMFVGAKCTLCRNKKWDAEGKRLAQ